MHLTLTAPAKPRTSQRACEAPNLFRGSPRGRAFRNAISYVVINGAILGVLVIVDGTRDGVRKDQRIGNSREGNVQARVGAHRVQFSPQAPVHDVGIRLVLFD